jgi:hypothetical protein
MSRRRILARGPKLTVEIVGDGPKLTDAEVVGVLHALATDSENIAMWTASKRWNVTYKQHHYVFPDIHAVANGLVALGYMAHKCGGTALRNILNDLTAPSKAGAARRVLREEEQPMKRKKTPEELKAQQANRRAVARAKRIMAAVEKFAEYYSRYESERELLADAKSIRLVDVDYARRDVRGVVANLCGVEGRIKW